MVHLTDQNTDNNSRLVYRIVEVKLEHIADNLLSAKNNPDNILQDIHDTIEKIFITSAMRLKNNNVTQAAKLLGISRPLLYRKMHQYQIS